MDFYDVPIINFNVKADEALPSSVQRIGGYPERRGAGGGVYPLTHYFIKAGFGKDYDSHYAALTAAA